jgi:hypothetical protein
MAGVDEQDGIPFGQRDSGEGIADCVIAAGNDMAAGRERPEAFDRTDRGRDQNVEIRETFCGKDPREEYIKKFLMVPPVGTKKGSSAAPDYNAPDRRPHYRNLGGSGEIFCLIVSRTQLLQRFR